jgi:hypothetical protein
MESWLCLSKSAAIKVVPERSLPTIKTGAKGCVVKA